MCMISLWTSSDQLVVHYQGDCLGVSVIGFLASAYLESACSLVVSIQLTYLQTGSRMWLSIVYSSWGETTGPLLCMAKLLWFCIVGLFSFVSGFFLMSLIKFVLWNSGKTQEFKALLPPRGRICPTGSCLVSDSVKRKIVRLLLSLSRPLVHSALVYTSDYEHILNS